MDNTPRGYSLNDIEWRCAVWYHSVGSSETRSHIVACTSVCLLFKWVRNDHFGYGLKHDSDYVALLNLLYRHNLLLQYRKSLQISSETYIAKSRLPIQYFSVNLIHVCLNMVYGTALQLSCCSMRKFKMGGKWNGYNGRKGFYEIWG